MTRGVPHLVLFFTRATSLEAWSEIGTFSREAAFYEQLVGRGFRVTFVTYGGRRDRELAARIPRIRVVCNAWNLREARYQALLTSVYPLLWGRRRAIFKSNQVKGADVALRAARRHGRPFVARCGYLLSGFSAQEHGPDSRQARAAVELERTVFCAATRVSVTTPGMARSIVESYGVDPSRVSVVPNYVDTDLFSPPLPAPRAQCSGTKPRLVFVGRLIPQKNLPALFDAVAGMDVELLIVGNDVLNEELRAAVAARRLPVTFLGNVPNGELPRVLRSADVFVLPSLYEGHPKALIEAMACGVPVLGADVAGIREIVAHGDTGWLCGTTPHELRAGIQRLLDDPDLRERLGRAARAFVTDRFSLAQVLDKETEMLRQCLSL